MNNPIEVFRIEMQGTGAGIFTAPGINSYIRLQEHPHGLDIAYRHFSLEWPNINEDRELWEKIDETAFDDKGSFQFGYNSEEQFNRAFTKQEVKEAIDLGFRVYKIKVDDYLQSKYQTIFMNPLVKEDISDKFLN